MTVEQQLAYLQQQIDELKKMPKVEKWVISSYDMVSAATGKTTSYFLGIPRGDMPFIHLADNLSEAFIFSCEQNAVIQLNMIKQFVALNYRNTKTPDNIRNWLCEAEIKQIE